MCCAPNGSADFATVSSRASFNLPSRLDDGTMSSNGRVISWREGRDQNFHIPAVRNRTSLYDENSAKDVTLFTARIES
jgi:hypothetical protein